MNTETGKIITLAEGAPVPKNVVEISPATKELLELVEEDKHERGAVWAMIAKYRIPEACIRGITKDLRESGKTFPVSGGVAVSFMIPYIKEISIRSRTCESGSNFAGRTYAGKLSKKAQLKKLAKARRKKKR